MVNQPLNPLLAGQVESLQDRFPQYVDLNIDPMGWVTVEPGDGACPMYLIDLGSEFVFGLGRGNCRWELETKSPGDVEFFSKVWRAVVAGHVREWRAPNRAYVEVDLPDQSVASTSTYSGARGLIPIRGWRRSPKYLHTYMAYV